MSELIKLNDYLYAGDTVHEILKKYTRDLRKHGYEDDNQVDLIHSEFLAKLTGFLERNDFLRSQSETLSRIYYHLTEEYPYLSFSFRGRIKALIRAEEKFNGYVATYLYSYYEKHRDLPTVEEMRPHITDFRDLIAYRLTISLPKSHITNVADKEKAEIDMLYEIANELPELLTKLGFDPEPLAEEYGKASPRLREDVQPYYKDYIEKPTSSGYQSLHITVHDKQARCYVELQLRTKKMDDYAEIGPANHFSYEQRQHLERCRTGILPIGESRYYDEALERSLALRQLDLSEVDVDMFGAINNYRINDNCGLLKGRLVRPFEHLSSYQSD